MNDRQIDRLVRQAHREAAAVVESLDLSQGGQELLEEIMSTSISPHLDLPDSESVDLGEPVLPGVPRRRRRSLVTVAAAAALIAAIAGPTIVFRSGNADTVVPGTGVGQSPVPTLANSSGASSAGPNQNPRLLLDDPTWKITYVLESSATTGEMQFTSGASRLQVDWYSDSLYSSYYTDRVAALKDQDSGATTSIHRSPPVPFTGVGGTGVVFDSGAEGFEVLVHRGEIFLDIAGWSTRNPGTDVGVELLSKLKPVPLQKWLRAMPDSVVTPAKAAVITKQMLADVPLPPDFDKSMLPTSSTMNYYDFGAAVIGTVTCAWLDDYQSAREANDKAGMATVDAALRTSTKWKVLQQMSKTGDYPWVLGQIVGRVFKRQDAGHYKQALGCN